MSGDVRANEKKYLDEDQELADTEVGLDTLDPLASLWKDPDWIFVLEMEEQDLSEDGELQDFAWFGQTEDLVE